MDAESGLPRTGYGVRHDDFETFYETIKFNINKILHICTCLRNVTFETIKSVLKFTSTAQWKDLIYMSYI